MVGGKKKKKIQKKTTSQSIALRSFINLFELDTTKTDIFQQCIRCCTRVLAFVHHQMSCPESTKILTSQHEKGIELTYVPYVPGSFARNPGNNLYCNLGNSIEKKQLWGTALKIGKLFKNWQKRYFCYEQDEQAVHYYENAPSSSRRETARGTIKLDKNTTVLQLDRVYDIGFEIITQKRTYYLLFQSVGERNLWAKVLQDCVSKTIDAAAEIVERDELEDYCAQISPGTYKFSDQLEILNFCIEVYGENHIVIGITSYMGNAQIISWDVTRKFSEFLELRNKLTRFPINEKSSEHFGVYMMQGLPTYLKLRDSSFVNECEEELEDFLQMILSIPKFRQSETVQTFLNTSVSQSGSRKSDAQRPTEAKMTLKDSRGRRARGTSIDPGDDAFFQTQIAFASSHTPERKNHLLHHRNPSNSALNV